MPVEVKLQPSLIGNHPDVTPRIRRALEFVRSRYCDPALDLHQAANAVRLSTYHLSRLLKRATGVGFTIHLRALRVRRAQELLRTSDLNVKEVAASVGYANTNALDRNFKAIVGVTPTVYRRQMTIGPERTASDREIESGYPQPIGTSTWP